MIQDLVLVAHGIFVRPKVGQPLRYKVRKGVQGLFTRHGQTKAHRSANAVTGCIHLGHHLAGDGIGFKVRQRWRLNVPGQGFAVFGIIVPLAAIGFAVGSHEQIKVSPHSPVEILHDHPLLRFSVRVRIELSDEELGIG